MNKSTIIALVLLIAAALFIGFLPKHTPNTTTDTNDSPDPSVISTVSYLCEEGKTMTVSYKDDSASVVVSDGRSLDLAQTPSASGTQYGNAEITLVSKGNDAFLEEGDHVTYSNCIANAANGDSNNETHTFTDGGKTFSFDYTNDVTISGSGIGYTQDWMLESKALGLILAKATLPRSFQPKTNFSEAVFKVSTSSDPIALKECLTEPMGGSTTVKNSATIDGVPFTVFIFGDAGAGNLYNTTTYRAVRNNQCYALEYTVHSTNIGNYSPDQGIKEFDKVAVQKVLDGMIQSFKFLE